MTPAFPMMQATSGWMSATSAPLLAAIDNLWIFVAIAIGSFIIEWLNKRNQPGNRDASRDETESLRNTGPTASRPAEPPPLATSDWEEELRRLLGQLPAPKPPPVPTSQPSAKPPPIRPVVIEAPVPLPSPGASAPPVTRAGSVMAEAERSVDVELPSLKDSVAAYQRASHLQEQVVERLKHVEELTARHLARPPMAHRPAVSSDAVRSIAFIRDRNTVRQAIIAGLVFGAPKGLENE